MLVTCLPYDGLRPRTKGDISADRTARDGAPPSHGLRNELDIGMKWLCNAIRRTRIFSDKGIGKALPCANRNAIQVVLTRYS